MKTTLNAIRKHSPCTEGWTKLLTYLGKTKADDDQLDLLTILESNGLSDALWCLRAVQGYDKEKRLFAVFCAKQVQHLMTDERSYEAIEVAEKYANGLATEKELEKAYEAARAAADAAACATYAAYAAACAAAYAAADAADAAYAADAADAAADAADAAACAAAYVAYAAYEAADAADAAYAAARAAQEAEFRRIFS
jgi:hypothetical protein